MKIDLIDTLIKPAQSIAAIVEAIIRRGEGDGMAVPVRVSPPDNDSTFTQKGKTE